MIYIHRVITYAFALLMPISVMGWGQKGHDVTAAIAEGHLTERTAAAVDSLLQGKSLVYWSNWLDNASHTPEYDYTRTWHYKNIDEDQTLSTSFVHPKGDIIRAIDEQSALLGKGGENEPLALKIVVHLMGDIHQPMHMGRYTDRGGNNHKVYFFERETNLHSVWDSSVAETGHKWSYTEWADQIDRAPERLQLILEEGTTSDWATETWEIAREVYRDTPIDTVVNYDYIAHWTPVIEQQLLKAGLRLAHILNAAYDPEYRSISK